MDSRFDGVKGKEKPDWFPAGQSFGFAWVDEYCDRTSAPLNKGIAAWARGDVMPPMPPSTGS